MPSRALQRVGIMSRDLARVDRLGFSSRAFVFVAVEAGSLAVIGFRWRHVAPPCVAVCLLILALAVGGCARYRPMALDPSELQRALERRSPVAADQGLTLGQAEALCLSFNPALRLARWQARAVMAAERGAGLWDDPVLEGDILRIVGGGADSWITGGLLSLSIPISGRLNAERARAASESEVALLQAWQAEQEALRELRGAWATWEEATASLGAVGESTAALEDLVRLVDRLADAGEVRLSEAAAFRTALAQRRIDAEKRRAEVRVAGLKIIALLGLPSESAVLLARDRTQVEEKSELPSSPTLEEVAARHPEALVRLGEYEVAERSLKLEIRKQFPDIEFGPAFGREEGSNRFGVGFSIPLPVLNGNSGAIGEAEAARQVARAAWEQAIQRGLSDAAIARIHWDEAATRASSIRETLVPLADAQWNEAQRLAQLGEFDALLLLAAIESHEGARLAQAEALRDMGQALADWNALMPTEPESYQVSDEELQ